MSARAHLRRADGSASPLKRRRWLNGSFFAGVYALTHTFQLFGTQHSKRKICFLMLQAVYNLINVVFSWIGLSCAPFSPIFLPGPSLT